MPLKLKLKWKISLVKPRRYKFHEKPRFGSRKTSEVSKTSEVWVPKNFRGFQNLRGLAPEKPPRFAPSETFPIQKASCKSNQKTKDRFKPWFLNKSSPTTFLIFFAAATRTWFIAPNFLAFFSLGVASLLLRFF